MDHTFRWNERLHLKSDFKRVFQQGRRYSMSGITMWALQCQRDMPGQQPRMGLAIPKTYGNAVARNRMKRLLREVFRLNKAKLQPGVDMVFSARAGAGRSAVASGKPRYQAIEPLIIKLWTLAKLLQPSLGS